MKVTQLERELARHAYENVIERCARLSAFSGSAHVDISFEDILTRQKTLAIDDVIVLSISARRLIAVCGVTLNGDEARVRKWKFIFQNDETLPVPQDDFVSLGRLLGIIIHCEKLEIIDSDLMAQAILNPFGYEKFSEWCAKHASSIEYFSPKILIRSDKSEFMIFEIADLIERIDELLLPEVVEAAKGHGLYLEDDYRF
ncbi:hypothetical protein HBA54_08355 [Pelagibius litoralis]|uniref:Uncharacterized protein n=1 Tax=Pelagibius litoralis TaxID=374515 RepID=A0A967EVF6_9PROT|nr:hypothetical protein [Pelagibius litoralis]NIA68601.1 hypothetical protein [Pelagibius litoralis]